MTSPKRAKPRYILTIDGTPATPEHFYAMAGGDKDRLNAWLDRHGFRGRAPVLHVVCYRKACDRAIHRVRLEKP